jgi:hypothetical protein
MKKTFTLYHETLDTKNAAASADLFQCEGETLSSKNFHDGPSKMVIHNILSYAKALKVVKTKNAGIINLVSN